MKKILLSIITMGILINLNAETFSDSSKYQDKISSYKDIDNNYVKPDIVKFIERKGYDYNEIITDTQNLRLDSEKIYIEGNKKAILIKVTNKTSKAINVEKEVTEGNAYPKILSPFGIGYLVVTNDNLNKPINYDTLPYNDRLVRIMNSGSISEISKYFYSDIEIYHINGINVNKIDKRIWAKNNISKTKLFIIDRVDRIIDESSNRSGLFVNGFVKVNSEFYMPVSYYIIVNQGKIVKIFEKDEYLKFDDFKKILYSLDK